MGKKAEESDGTIPTIEIYKQQYAHFGRMNDLLYKLPTIYSALVGALWYFGFTSLDKDRIISFAVFCFAAVICRYSITITNQFRSAFNLYIDRINLFDREFSVSIKQPSGTKARGSKKSSQLSTVRAVARTLWCALIISILGALYAASPSIKSIGVYILDFIAK